MNRIAPTLTLVLALALPACGGGEPDTEGEPAMEEVDLGEDTAVAPGGAVDAITGELTMPTWMLVDHDAQSVNLTIEAGATSDLNYWNYNGAGNGNATIVVPAGYEVTIDFQNSDPNQPHSLGIEEGQANWSAQPEVSPEFEGAVTPNPASLTEARPQPGESVTITFTADTPGEYAMVCYIPGHAVAGMWVNFRVSDGEEAGAQGFPVG